MRVGQKNKLTYRWARKGSRPRAVHDQRTQSTYLFGAVCPERGTGAALVLPACNSEAMQLHLDEIATKVTPGAHAIVLLDQAGWHGAKALKVPSNISLLLLPPRAPELNSQENIWQFMRQNWLSNRIFKSFDDIVDHCCYAWNTLIDQPWKIMSIARREVTQSEDWYVVRVVSSKFLTRQHGAQPAPPTSRRTQLEFGRRPRALPFGPLSKALIVLSDPQHRDFSLRIIHLIRKNPRFFCDFLPAAAWRPRDTEQSPYPADHRLGGRDGSDEPVWRAVIAKRLNCTIAVTLANLSVAEKVRISLVPMPMQMF